MKREPLISVVVPVYKVENYLQRCVNSILIQTYKNLEIILVDDGSPDLCGVMCDQYSRMDNRVKVIHKPNGGLSDARNAALDVMQGEYVVFVDSDDYVTEYYVAHLWHALLEQDAEMAISGFVDVFEGQTHHHEVISALDDLQVLSPKQCLKRLLYQDGIDTSAWGKLYRRDLFDDLRYPKGKLYEDIPVTYRVIHRCSRIAVCSNADYYYLHRAEGIQYSIFSSAKLDAVIHMDELKAFVFEYYPDLSAAAICRHFSAVCNILFQIEDSEKHSLEIVFLWKEIVKDRKKVLLDREGRLKARVAAALSYLGYNAVSAVYRKTQRRGNRKTNGQQQ